MNYYDVDSDDEEEHPCSLNTIPVVFNNTKFIEYTSDDDKIPSMNTTIFTKRWMVKSIPMPSDYKRGMYIDDGPYDRVTYIISDFNFVFTERNARVLDLEGLTIFTNVKHRLVKRRTRKRIRGATVYVPREIVPPKHKSIVRMLTCDGVLFIKGLTYSSDAALWHVLCSFLNDRPNPNYLCYCTFKTFSNILLTLEYRCRVNRALILVNKLLAIGYYLVGNFNYVSPQCSLLGYLGDVLTSQVVAWTRISQIAMTSESPKIREAFVCMKRLLTVSWLTQERTDLSSDSIYKTLLKHEHVIAAIFCSCDICRPPPAAINQKRALTVKNWITNNKNRLSTDPNLDFRTRWNLDGNGSPEMPRLFHSINFPTVYRGIIRDRYLRQFYKFQNMVRFHVLTHTCSLQSDELLFFQWWNEFLFLYYLRLYLSKCVRHDYTQAVGMFSYYLKAFRLVACDIARGKCVNPSILDLCEKIAQIIERVTADSSMTCILREICNFNRLVRDSRHAWIFPHYLRDDTGLQGKVILEHILREKFISLRVDEPLLEHVGLLRSKILNETVKITFNEFTLRQLERSMWLENLLENGNRGAQYV
ncbi:protein ORF-B [Elephant endotheliotropic herpesvirus 5B]|uniref:Protein EE11 n=1 Tax=Elephant endotheliotropic herpesvirus 5 TaxID=768738 RepID=A0A075CYN8_9BETA|nr:protein EE11 [Elephant endotheliotropic herpesvirus 5]AHC02832.1 protein EE11 [Elephant endotheliotropic herpesvirus 5]UVZ35231.1 protein ORF-B [Elephant endotheliotropic herpesvirus 5B]